MREAFTIEYIVLLMTDSHPAALKVAPEPQRHLDCSRVKVQSEETRKGPGEAVVPMIPSPIHFLAYTRPFRPVVEPRGTAGVSN